MARPKRLLNSEKKTARVSLLLSPRLHADILTLAQIKGVSVNDFFTTLAEQIVAKNSATIMDARKALDALAPDVSFELERREI